jgi:hypothetical protein
VKAIVLTTINVPKNIPEFMEKADGEWIPIIVGDLKTPHGDVEKICKQNHGVYLSPEKQVTLGFSHAAAVSWNCYDRKNIGYLFALREGAEIIYSTDDDNFPTVDHWDTYIKLGKQKIETISSKSGWWNCCSLGDAKITPRGYPVWLIQENPEYKSTSKQVDIGIQVGLWVGDPDIDAMTRILSTPTVKKYQDKDVALDTGTMCPYNSQNTFISREMMPANMLWSCPRTEYYRYDDIFAGYVGQVIAWHHGKNIKFGHPLLRQDRNTHDLAKDLRSEIGGMECQKDFFSVLRSIELTGINVRENLRQIVYAELAKIPTLPFGLKTQVDTWCADLEKIGL